MKQYFRIEEVAEILSRSKRSIYRYVRDGKLRAERLFGRLWICDDSLQKFIKREQRVCKGKKV